jgi:hypothetical protein
VLQHVTLELRRADWPAAKRFWSMVGFEEVDPPGTLRSKSRWVERQGTQIHLLFAEEAPVVAPEGHVAVVAEDYELMIGRLRHAGFDVEAHREHWGAPRSFVTSPAGHRVELMAAPPS